MRDVLETCFRNSERLARRLLGENGTQSNALTDLSTKGPRADVDRKGPAHERARALCDRRRPADDPSVCLMSSPLKMRTINSRKNKTKRKIPTDTKQLEKI